MFIESSAPRRSGDNAILESPALTKSFHCFTMWYHMYGKNIGKLAVSAYNLLCNFRLLKINSVNERIELLNKKYASSYFLPKPDSFFTD